jgi:hypothetical protein
MWSWFADDVWWQWLIFGGIVLALFSVLRGGTTGGIV